MPFDAKQYYKTYHQSPARAQAARDSAKKYHATHAESICAKKKWGRWVKNEVKAMFRCLL